MQPITCRTAFFVVVAVQFASAAGCDVEDDGLALHIGNCDTNAVASMLQQLHLWNHAEQLTLELQYNGLGDARLQLLTDPLSKFANLTALDLDLYGNLLHSEGASLLGRALMQLDNLNTLVLHLGGNHLGDHGLHELVNALCSLKLSVLSLHAADCGLTALPAWTELGPGCLKTLKTLDLDVASNGLRVVPAVGVIGSCELPSLRKYVLHARSNHISVLENRSCSAPSALRTLELHLSDNVLESSAIAQLTSVLCKLPELQSIQLSLENQRVSPREHLQRSGPLTHSMLQRALAGCLPYLSVISLDSHDFVLAPKPYATSPSTRTSALSTSLMSSVTPSRGISTSSITLQFAASTASAALASTAASRASVTSTSLLPESTASAYATSNSTSVLDGEVNRTAATAQVDTVLQSAKPVALIIACLFGSALVICAFGAGLRRYVLERSRWTQNNSEDNDERFGNWTGSENEAEPAPSQTPVARPLRFSLDAAAQLQARLMFDRAMPNRGSEASEGAGLV